MKSKIIIMEWFVIVLLFLGIIGYAVYKVDPYMHFHKPYVDDYYYTLSNARYQNDGITKHFDYDAMITGTSMVTCFKTSEFDKLFGTKSIKIAYHGGAFKEINDNLAIALEYNPNLKIVVRSIDPGNLFDITGDFRYDTGTYPTYLYDKNPFNDVKYLCNKDVLLNRVMPMISDAKKANFQPGITSFDEYDNLQKYYIFGKNTVIPNGIGEVDSSIEQASIEHLSNEEREDIKENIQNNVTRLVEEYPDVDFYYFLPPYSIVNWRTTVQASSLHKQIEAERYVIELLLEHDNIHLYSFNNRTDIITDLNNYADDIHYGEWINSLILKWMHEGKYQLTKDNYEQYLSEELEFLTSFDYASLDSQEDYDQDIYAAALLNEELKGIEPKEILIGETADNNVVIENINGYDYLVFYAKYTDGKCDLKVYDENKSVVYEHIASEINESENDEWQRIVIELTDVPANGLQIQSNVYNADDVAVNGCALKDITLY